MLGLLLRVLPFWVREPLLIVVGSVFGARIMYLAVRDSDRVAAAIGAAFLVFTAIRVHTVVRAFRARRKPVPGSAAAVDGAGTDASGHAKDHAQAQAQAAPAGSQAPIAVPAAAAAPAPAPAPDGGHTGGPTGTAPRPAPGKPEKDHNAWGQAVAALAVFGALAAAVMLGDRVMPADTTTPRPASCSDAEDEKPPKAYARTPRAVTGSDLCEALNRPDLARLLGTPEEIANSASGSNGTALLTDGKVAEPDAQITFDTYSVKLSATYNEMSTAQYIRLIDMAGDRIASNMRTARVLGRPAVFSSEHTMKIEFNLGGGQKSAPAQQGPLARTLSVALDRKDKGGYYDLTVWSQTGALPSDSALLDIAEKVLPRIPARSGH
ncbi:DUF6215 domain-containing protein [Streptomyces cellostaticus]|uniref:DUF6215 domain-containing protein n=1 Tax=Streptomyces cellostaticus TaxID=67285 RepID=UPI002025CE66|nr:DUF6215 domain-containing protein [Streptomyces cellostaticus]